MKKKDKFRPFASRLTRRLVLALFIMLSIIGFLMILFGWTIVEMQSAQNYQSQAHGNVETVQRIQTEVYVASLNHVPEIERNLDRPDQLLAVTEEIVSLNPHIHSCGISFIADYYPQKGHAFQPYTLRLDSGQVETKKNLAEEHDYLNDQWFKEALKADSGYWSKPFACNYHSDSPLVSYMTPIHDSKGSTVAILGIDLALDWLHDKLAHNDSITNGFFIENADKNDTTTTYLKYAYSFIITRDGTYISHPVKKRILEDNFLEYIKATPDTVDDYVAKMIVSGEKGLYKDQQKDGQEDLNIEGVDVYTFFEPIENTDWTMVLIVPWFNISLWSMALTVFLVFFLLIGILVVYFVSRYNVRKATKPLNQLTASTGEVAKGNFDTPLPDIKYNDEIRQLRNSFEDMQHSLAKYVDELRTTTAQNAAIESELKIAHDIQMTMLPKTFPPYPDRHDIDIYGTVTPAKAVGGDLFDFFIRDEKLFFCIGDVSGKGVPASLVMAVTRSLFRNVSAHTAVPHHILKALNDVMADKNDTNMFVTLFVGVLDLSTGQLNYCNAGHESPLLIGEHVEQLPCEPNLPVGVMTDYTFTSQTVAIMHDTTIFMFTDGLNEAEDATQAQFGDERIMGVAQTLSAEGTLDPQTIVERMAAAVSTFVGDADQSDDMTMLAVRRTTKE